MQTSILNPRESKKETTSSVCSPNNQQQLSTRVPPGNPLSTQTAAVLRWATSGQTGRLVRNSRFTGLSKVSPHRGPSDHSPWRNCFRRPNSRRNSQAPCLLLSRHRARRRSVAARTFKLRRAKWRSIRMSMWGCWTTKGSSPHRCLDPRVPGMNQASWTCWVEAPMPIFACIVS